MISDRDFWTPILEDEQASRLALCGMASIDDFLWFLTLPNVSQHRYDGGGIVFVNKGSYDEVHVAFHPSKWGRHVAMCFRDCFAKKMKSGVPVVAGEQEGEWRTKPPITHGWKVIGSFEKSVLPRRVRQWILTQDAWNNSPVGRKST